MTTRATRAAFVDAIAEASAAATSPAFTMTITDDLLIRPQ